MDFVCSVLCEELNSSSQIIFSMKIKPFLILLFLNKLVGWSFLREPVKSMVTLIFKMLLKQKTKSFPASTIAKFDRALVSLTSFSACFLPSLQSSAVCLLPRCGHSMFVLQVPCPHAAMWLYTRTCRGTEL